MKHTLVLTGLLAACVFGQPRPDFSGTWKSAGATEQNYRLEKITHRDPALKVETETRFSGRLSGGMHDENAYLIDGVERAATIASGATIWRTNSWEGVSLIFLIVRKDGYRIVVTRELWTLSEDGTQLTKTRRVIDMDGVTESRQIFIRQ